MANAANDDVPKVAGSANAPLLPAELRARRCGLGLTQASLANALGVAGNTVARWERGQRPVGAPELVRLALERLESSHNHDQQSPQGAVSRARIGYPQSSSAARSKRPARALQSESQAEEAAAPTERRITLPSALTSFVGREREVASVQRLLNASRLLTLVGPAGIGKTRLALRIATGAPSRVLWVELAPCTDAGQVARAVASAVGLVERARRPLLEILVAALREQPFLLVFDNCEHLVETVAELADRLLRACPLVRLLATSREALGVAGEATWLVPPLALPDPGGKPSVHGLAQSDAVQLFVERASAVAHFSLTDSNVSLIAELCQRLEGNPLALELAAARVGGFGIDELLARLDDRFRLLVSTGRHGPTRQQTLRAAIDWSYDLLTEHERRLFERLSTFMGGWRLDAAESVGSGDGIEPDNVPDLLMKLVAKSVVVSEPTPDGVTVRYRLLETLRQYGQERLAERGELDEARRRHAGYCLQLVQPAWWRSQRGRLRDV